MALASLKMVTLDSSDVRRDAAFWSAVLGWEVRPLPGRVRDALGARRHRPRAAGSSRGTSPPGWPNENGSKQFHLDLAVDDLDAAAQDVVSLGGTLPDEQPGETWRVLLDPSGHPFCLTRAANWG